MSSEGPFYGHTEYFVLCGPVDKVAVGVHAWATIPAQVRYEHRWGDWCKPGMGLPLNWFNGDQQWHLMAHQMNNLPTMTVLAKRSAHQQTALRQCVSYVEMCQRPQPRTGHVGHV